MCNTCVRFFVFINHFSSSVCVSSCNQRDDYLIGLGYSDLKMRVWWSQDSNDDYVGILPMVYISSEKRLPSLWRHTSHHTEGTLHNTISKSLPPESTKILPPENIKWSLRTIFFSISKSLPPKNTKWGESLGTIVFFLNGLFKHDRNIIEL